jgi:hypothetical protein
LRKLKGLAPDVARYTKAATISKNPTGKNGKSDVMKDTDKEKRVSSYCKTEGHLKERCWGKQGRRIRRRKRTRRIEIRRAVPLRQTVRPPLPFIPSGWLSKIRL